MTFLIYKQVADAKTGIISEVELCELDNNEEAAHSYCKLYNLQRTIDEKQTTTYQCMAIDVAS